MPDATADAAPAGPESSPAFVPPNPKKWEDEAYAMVINSARQSGRALPAGHEEAWRQGFKYGWGLAIDMHAPEGK